MRYWHTCHATANNPSGCHHSARRKWMSSNPQRSCVPGSSPKPTPVTRICWDKNIIHFADSFDCAIYIMILFGPCWSKVLAHVTNKTTFCIVFTAVSLVPWPQNKEPLLPVLAGDFVAPNPQDVAQGQDPRFHGVAQVFLQLAEHGALQGVLLAGTHLAVIQQQHLEGYAEIHVPWCLRIWHIH